MYAVVTTGGKQFKVLEGDVVRVAKIDQPVGNVVELNHVTMLVKGTDVVLDTAALDSAKVVCNIVAQGRARKIRVYKRKRKKNYARTQGHRQDYTEIKIQQIVG